jgi:hypothetical protein
LPSLHKLECRDRRAREGALPSEASEVERMKRKLQTQVGARVYATRKSVVEPVFGQIKQGREFRQFLLRGWRRCVASGP